MHTGPQAAARIRRESELRVVRLIWVGGQRPAARMEIILPALLPKRIAVKESDRMLSFGQKLAVQ